MTIGTRARSAQTLRCSTANVSPMMHSATVASTPIVCGSFTGYSMNAATLPATARMRTIRRTADLAPDLARVPRSEAAVCASSDGSTSSAMPRPRLTLAAYCSRSEQSPADLTIS